MKKLLPVSLLIVLLSMFIIACNKNTELIEGKEISVPLNSCKDVKANAGVRVCYDSLTYDSRCPEDVVCISSGFAMIKVSLIENGNIHHFKMLYAAGNHQHVNQFGGVSDTMINGYKIALTGLLPYPRVSGPTPTPDQYKAVFTITH